MPHILKSQEPIKLYDVMNDQIDEIIQKHFDRVIKPVIIAAMKKLKIARVEEMNNYIFLTLEDGTSVIDTEFNSAQERFYNRYLFPLQDSKYLASRLTIDIKA